ncbi:MAG: hypothetical protein KC583_12120 [Myxococcales bacterium]|nr:hypothetical protein [Myxococcales bacterium]
MTPLRVAAVGLLVVTAGLALHLLDHHDDARDAHEAARLAQTARFGPTTRFVVGRYLRATRPDVELAWTGHPAPGLFERTTTAELVAGGEVYRFRVDLASGAVTAADAPTEALVEATRAWARAHDGAAPAPR